MEDTAPTRSFERAEAILGAVAFSAGSLSRADPWQDAVPDMLARLGESSGVSRAYLFENETDEGGVLRMSETFEWTALGISRTIEDPRNQGAAYEDGCQRYVDVLGGGQALYGPAESFSARERQDLEVEGIRSIALVPVFAGDLWWGYLGFDDCREQRRWATIEIDALRAAADVLGAAIERGQIAERLNRAEMIYRLHVERLPAITYVEFLQQDASFGYGDLYVSPQIETFLGYTQQEWLDDEDGSWWLGLIHPDDRQAVIDEDREATAERRPYGCEYRIARADGGWVWVRDEAHLVENAEGLPPYYHGIISDITERKTLEEQIAYLAYHDSLTGLANRGSFEQRLEEALARARRAGTGVAVLYMDLDRFKEVNDTLGHHVGDMLLKQVAARMTDVVRETDLVARLGGDEFAVLLPDLELGRPGSGSDDPALKVAEEVAARVRLILREPFALDGARVQTAGSIGISIFPLDAEDGRQLLKNADVAMYESKHVEGGKVVPFLRAV